MSSTKKLVLVIFSSILINLTLSKLSSEIVTVTDNNINILFHSSQEVLILFTQDSCPKCNLLGMYFIDLQREVTKNELPVKLFRVDVSLNQELAAKFDIDYLPSMKLIYGKTKIVKNYKGDANLRDMVDFVTK
jgi:thioredoxin-like negative regulator of GroEL